MLDTLLGKLSAKHQGVLALIMGLVLVLGSLGKLGILQGVLNALMIGVGLVLVAWGINKSNSIGTVKRLFKKK